MSSWKLAVTYNNCCKVAVILSRYMIVRWQRIRPVSDNYVNTPVSHMLHRFDRQKDEVKCCLVYCWLQVVMVTSTSIRLGEYCVMPNCTRSGPVQARSDAWLSVVALILNINNKLYRLRILQLCGARLIFNTLSAFNYVKYYTSTNRL